MACHSFIVTVALVAFNTRGVAVAVVASCVGQGVHFVIALFLAAVFDFKVTEVIKGVNSYLFFLFLRLFCFVQSGDIELNRTCKGTRTRACALQSRATRRLSASLRVLTTGGALEWLTPHRDRQFCLSLQGFGAPRRNLRSHSCIQIKSSEMKSM